MSTKFADISAF